MTLRAAIYARFSSDKQRDRSIEDQVALCRQFCERDGLSVVGVYEDRAISGASTANRLGWQRLMKDARAARFDVVVAEALDRISRDQEDLAGIHKRLRFRKIEIRTVQDGKAEEIHVGIKGLLGVLYLKDLAQKTKRGQARVIRDGRHNGGRSFGYRPVPGEPGRLEILPDESRHRTSDICFLCCRPISSRHSWGVESRRNSCPSRRLLERFDYWRQSDPAERYSAKPTLHRPDCLESSELHQKSRERSTCQST